jgi:N-acetylmuramoyl-L-alanine amidase
MDLIISDGHTLIGKGTGAVGFLNESICTREIGERVKNILEARGHNVTYLRVDQSENDLYDRVSMANASNGTLFAEIHLNAGGGLGTEVYTYGAKEIPEARQVLNNIVALGFKNRGIKDGKGLYVIRNTKMTAMLIECCFVDTKEDADRYNADNIALAIANGLVGDGTIIDMLEPNHLFNPGKIEKPTQVINNAYNGYITGEDVKMLQAEINKQFNKGLAVDGLIGPKTLAELPIVKQGAKGNITFVIQELLKKKGFNLNSDGAFGPITDSMVKQFQSNVGIGSDGIVGPVTWKKLLEA